MNQFFKGKYTQLKEVIPFVGNTYSKYQGGNTFVLVDAPHLSHNMTIYCWLEGYESLFKKEEQ